jgi:hypothetical protein
MQDISKEQLAEAAALAEFVTRNLKPVVESVVPEFLGRNASPTNAAYPAIVQASATIIAARIIADAIRESGEVLKAIDESIMVTV